MATSGSPIHASELPKFTERAFTAFDEAEVADLELFRDLVSDLDRRSLATRETLYVAVRFWHQRCHRGSRHQPDPRCEKARVLERPGQLQSRRRNLLGRHAHEAGTPESAVALKWLADLKTIHDELLASARIGGVLAVEEPTGESTTLTPRELMDAR